MTGEKGGPRRGHGERRIKVGFLGRGGAVWEKGGRGGHHSPGRQIYSLGDFMLGPLAPFPLFPERGSSPLPWLWPRVLGGVGADTAQVEAQPPSTLTLAQGFPVK